MIDQITRIWRSKVRSLDQPTFLGKKFSGRKSHKNISKPIIKSAQCNQTENFVDPKYLRPARIRNAWLGWFFYLPDLEPDAITSVSGVDWGKKVLRLKSNWNCQFTDLLLCFHSWTKIYVQKNIQPCKKQKKFELGNFQWVFFPRKKINFSFVPSRFEFFFVFFKPGVASSARFWNANLSRNSNCPREETTNCSCSSGLKFGGRHS